MEDRLVEKLEEGWEEKLVEGLEEKLVEELEKEMEEERELVELLLHSQAGERTTYIQDYIGYIDCILRRLHQEDYIDYIGEMTTLTG